MHFLLNLLAKPLRIIYIFAVLFWFIQWVDEINTTEYMQRGSESFKQTACDLQIAIATDATPIKSIFYSFTILIK